MIKALPVAVSSFVPAILEDAPIGTRTEHAENKLCIAPGRDSFGVLAIRRLSKKSYRALPQNLATFGHVFGFFRK